MSKKTASVCRICSNKIRSEDELTFKKVPLSNFYPHGEVRELDLYDLGIGQCRNCGLVQLTKYPRRDLIVPTHSWLRYNEPEFHLVEVSSYLSAIFIGKKISVLGVGPFEQALLNQLSSDAEKKQINLLKHLKKQSERFPYLESYEEVLSEKKIKEIKIEYGSSDLILCRYLLEHGVNPILMLKNLGKLLKPGGLLYIEIPDSSKFLELCDYSFIWEEHLSYFTEKTFMKTVQLAGYEVYKFMRFSGLLEDALTYVLRPVQNYCEDKTKVNYEIKKYKEYQFNFNKIKKSYINSLKGLIASGKKIAVFGAGHQAIMFINLVGIGPYVTKVIDDDPNKIGVNLPLSNIKIIGCDEAFSSHSIGIILLAISPKIETEVIKKIRKINFKEIEFYSIFEGSSLGTLIR